MGYSHRYWGGKGATHLLLLAPLVHGDTRGAFLPCVALLLVEQVPHTPTLLQGQLALTVQTTQHIHTAGSARGVKLLRTL